MFLPNIIKIDPYNFELYTVSKLGHFLRYTKNYEYNEARHLCKSERPMSEWKSRKLQPSDTLQLCKHYWEIGRPTEHHVDINGQLKPSIVGKVK